jgi:hypothetical protein
VEDHEEYEHIPWSELTTKRSLPGGRTLKVAAAVIGAAVVGIVAGRSLGSPGSADPVPAPVVGAAVEAAEDAASETTVAAVPAPLPQLPGLYSEADLMAFPPAGPERAAATRAEWFVYDYFTADMEPTGSADVASALPAGAKLPDMPQDSVSSLSYVEWARAFRVEEVGESTYRVGVLFRMLGAPPDRGFFRLAARAVEVTVAVSPEGGTVVTDLPTPIALPAAPEPDPWPEEGDREVPSQFVDEAILAARGWGTEPRLVSAQPVEEGWRVVLTVADDVGNRWPLAVRVDGREHSD